MIHVSCSIPGFASWELGNKSEVFPFGSFWCIVSGSETHKIVDSGEASRLQHERYLVAVNNLFRKRLLEALRRGGSTAKELKTTTKLNQEALGWHLNVLTSALCIETEPCAGSVIYKLPKREES